MVVPALRFPEFRDAEGWKRKPLIEVAHIIAGQSPDGSSCNDNGIGMPFYQGKTDFGEIFLNSPTKWTSQTTKTANDGDILMSVRAPVGTLNISTNEICIGRGLAAIQPYQNKWFLYYFLNSIQNTIIGNGGSVFDSINKDQIEKIEILIPENQKEQEEIANCFTCLDDLIIAVADKIEALKLHKKGLMQQLFPAEGKTIPALRFPEFKNSGEWEIEKEFSQYIKLYRGSSPRPIKEYLTQDEDGVNWIKIGDTKLANNYVISNIEEKITQEGATKSRYVYKGELILANSMSFGKTYQLKVEGCIYDGWFVLREYENSFHQPFLLQLLNSEYMQNQYSKLSAGGIVQNISSDIVYQTKLPHTSIDEQKRIADCLSSVDDLISAEADKLDQLKAHKKGLMQQLFPTINE